MDMDNLYNFIVAGGFKTLNQIKEEFKDTNPEILEINLEYLTNKKNVHMIKYKLNNTSEPLYYIQG